MDRTAWIAIPLCVVGLVLWEIYSVKQIRRGGPAAPPAIVQASPASPAPSIEASPGAVTSATALAAAAPTPAASPAASAASFHEQTELLSNSDLELHLTNRGGGIASAVLLNHMAEEGKRVTLNSEDHLPIAAIVDDPAAPQLPEYKLARDNDGVTCEFVTPDQITIHKKFLFPSSNEKKDNYIAEVDLEMRNGGSSAYTKPGYFLALGSAAAIHPKDYPTYTRLVWCIDGKAKGIDVGRFLGGGGLLGMGARAPEP